VLDAGGGEVLGTTPLELTRRRGGALKLRFEKDGYAPLARQVSLEANQDLEVTLEKKPAAKSHGSHRSRDTEPAKL